MSKSEILKNLQLAILKEFTVRQTQDVGDLTPAQIEEFERGLRQVIGLDNLSERRLNERLISAMEDQAIAAPRLSCLDFPLDFFHLDFRETL